MRNYLRVRGEYVQTFGRGGRKLELPPRARRILEDTAAPQIPPGTTSACAENTAHRAYQGLSEGNYLRVRGEYFADEGLGGDE